MAEQLRQERRAGDRGAPRSAPGGFLALLALVGILSAAGWVSFRSGPDESESPSARRDGAPIVVEGLSGRVVILRDRRGIPHVEAARDEDVWAGLGFAHAEDRLSQMLWLRRLALGRTAELLGEDGLSHDRRIRTLGLSWYAHAEADALDPAALRDLEAYARGVNAHLERMRTGSAVATAEDRERSWEPVDSIAVLKLLSLGMGPSFEMPEVFADLIQTLGGVGASPLMPGGFGIAGVGVPFELPPRSLPPGRRGGDRAAALLRDSESRVDLSFATTLRARAWVVAGSATRSGAPMLAVDLHLPPTIPALVHEAQLEGPGIRVSGVTVPGVPVFWAGRGPRVAWALVPARVNTFQAYREELRPAAGSANPESLDGWEVRSGRQWLPLVRRDELIEVRGHGQTPSREVELVIHHTKHGPLIDEPVAGPLPGVNRVTSLGWLGAQPGAGMRSLIELASAASAEQLLGTLEGYRGPALNVVYADASGAAGVQLAGALPRHRLATGLLPVPGTQRVFDWSAWRSFEALPGARIGRALELESSDVVPVSEDPWLIVDDAPTPGSSPRQDVEWLWRSGRRSSGIERDLKRLAGRGPIELRELAETQAGSAIRLDSRVVPAIQKLLGPEPRHLSKEAREILGLISRWDGEVRLQSRGAAAFQVFEDELGNEVIGARIGSSLWDRLLDLAYFEPAAFLESALIESAHTQKPGGWTDPEALREAIHTSLHQAWIRLSYQQGPTRKGWVWGALHGIAFRPFVPSFESRGFFAGALPGSRRFESVLNFAAGDAGLGIADFDPGRPFGARRTTLYRMTVDLASPDRMLTSLAPGQSERPGSAHFQDGFPAWQQGRPGLLAMTRFLVEEQAVDRLVLEPKP